MKKLDTIVEEDDCEKYKSYIASELRHLTNRNRLILTNKFQQSIFEVSLAQLKHVLISKNKKINKK